MKKKKPLNNKKHCKIFTKIQKQKLNIKTDVQFFS